MNRIVLQNLETGELGKSWQAVARSQRRTFMVKSRRVASCSAVPTFTCGAGTSRAADCLRKNAGNFERLTRLFRTIPYRNSRLFRISRGSGNCSVITQNNCLKAVFFHLTTTINHSIKNVPLNLEKNTNGLPLENREILE